MIPCTLEIRNIDTYYILLKVSVGINKKEYMIPRLYILEEEKYETLDQEEIVQEFMES